MSGVDLLLAAAGTLVTVLTLAGMVLLTPRNVVDIHAEGADSQGSNLSPVSDREPEPASVHGHDQVTASRAAGRQT